MAENEEEDNIFMSIKSIFSSDINTEAVAHAEMLKKEAEESKQLAEDNKKLADENQVKFEDVQAKLEKVSIDYENMSKEFEVLKTFKINTEEKEFFSRVESVIAEVSEFLSTDKIDEMRENAKNFSVSDLNVWENQIKSEAFSVSKGKIKETFKMALPDLNNKNNKTNSNCIWDKIGK